MPISLDPEALTDVWLSADADKPAETRPAFVCRFGSYKQRMRLATALSDVVKLTDSEEQAKTIEAAIKPWIVGVKNLPSDDALEHLTLNEAHELGWEILKQTGLAEAERKKSTPVRQSDTASSAEPAPAASA